MKNIDLGKIGFFGTEIALGIMRIAGMSVKDATNTISTAYENGINFYDHADIYGKGTSEEIFAKSIKEAKIPRENIILQTKCGIKPIRDGFRTFDFSYNHILSSVESSLKRLNVEYIDSLLLHRPDTLMEPHEISEVFYKLHTSGKVRHFGISNFHPLQIELLQKYLNHKLIINQLQFSLMHTYIIDRGFYANRPENASIDHTGDILEYCRLKDITIQAWSPFQSPQGVFLDNPIYKKLNENINSLAQKYNVTNSAIVAAWIRRHPANMQVIIGTTNPQRIKDTIKSVDINLTREEWYELYHSTGQKLP